jgi:hypothetical protein
MPSLLIRDGVKRLVAEIILGRAPILISNRGPHAASRAKRVKRRIRLGMMFA